MLRRDKTQLRRWLHQRACKGMMGFMAERQQALFDLAVILAGAFHDAGHPGEHCCICAGYTAICISICVHALAYCSASM
jgi:hypothetical protein